MSLTQPINFSQIFFGDINVSQQISDYKKSGNKVPLDLFHSAYPGHIFKIPKVCIDDLINLLEEFLSTTKKLKWSKVREYVYTVEFHPIEKMEIQLTKINNIKLWASLECALKASDLFPHNFADDDDDDEIQDMPGPIIPGYPPSFNNWFTADICISYDPNIECYIVRFIRISGDGFSFTSIYRKLHNVLNEKNILWLVRKNYIKLLEGLGEQYEETHITQYLLNDLICRDICSFMKVNV